MKVTRTITYEGSEEWIRKCLEASLKDGVHNIYGARGGDAKITLTTDSVQWINGTISDAPESLKQAGIELFPKSWYPYDQVEEQV